MTARFLMMRRPWSRSPTLGSFVRICYYLKIKFEDLYLAVMRQWAWQTSVDVVHLASVSLIHLLSNCFVLMPTVVVVAAVAAAVTVVAIERPLEPTLAVVAVAMVLVSCLDAH